MSPGLSPPAFSRHAARKGWRLFFFAARPISHKAQGNRYIVGFRFYALAAAVANLCRVKVAPVEIIMRVHLLRFRFFLCLLAVGQAAVRGMERLAFLALAAARTLCICAFTGHVHPSFLLWAYSAYLSRY